MSTYMSRPPNRSTRTILSTYLLCISTATPSARESPRAVKSFAPLSKLHVPVEARVSENKITSHMPNCNSCSKIDSRSGVEILAFLSKHGGVPACYCYVEVWGGEVMAVTVRMVNRGGA